jgi:hypothetical protein
MKPNTLCSCLVVVVALACHGGVAAAQVACDEEAVRAGNELRRAGNDDAALAQFRQAWEACHTPRARAQMALAEAALGRWLDADAHLGETLASGGDRWIERNRSRLEAVRAQVAEHFGYLELRGNVPGAEVLLDGRLVGTMPLREPLRVVGGSASLTVRAPGYLPLTRAAVITAGQLVRENLELVREPEAATPATAPTVHSPPPPAAPMPAPRTLALAPPVTPAVAVFRPPVNPGGRGSTGSLERTLGWVAASGAVLAIGGGVWALAARESAVREHDDPRLACAMNDHRTACVQPRDTADTMQSLAIASFIGGAAFAATSLVLFVVAPRSPGATSSARLGCGAGPGTAGVSCMLRF